MTAKTNKKELIQKARGMDDILPKEYKARKNIFDKAIDIAEFYGFEPIQTPHLEKLELFTATIGETTDIIEKEMYSLKTKGGDKLVLRPEGTAPIVRAYIEHGMQTLPQPVMFYYTGAFFRYERPQKGRRREFNQFGLEILGEKDGIADATIIKTLYTTLEEAVGLKSLIVHINSIGCKECRKVYQKELSAYYRYRKNVNSICKDCTRRLKTNPLRLLDCKNENCLEIKREAPQIINYLCESCTNHFKEVLEILEASQVPYCLDHHLVRGLDYYCRTAFEFFTEEDKSLEIGGGGRYDMLSSILSNKEVPGVGGAFSLERVMEMLPEKEKSKTKQKSTKVFFIQLGVEAKYKSLLILDTLRKAKISVKHSLTKNNLRGQLKIASKLKVPYTIILGQKEALENTVIIRNMESLSQETIPLEKLTDYLKKKNKYG